MDTPESLIGVNDFAKRIEGMATDPAKERFVRELVAEIAMDCPLHIIKKIATCVLDLRRAELLSSSQRN